MAYTSCGETTFVAAAITWARSVFPPTSCRTFGCLDLRRVPLPAAIIAMATRGALLLVFAFDIRSNDTRLYAGMGSRPIQARTRQPRLQSERSLMGMFLKRQLHQVLRDSAGVMPGDLTLIKVIAQDWTNSQFSDGIFVDYNLRRAFERVLGFQGFRDGCRIQQGVVENSRLGMLIERPNVVGGTASQTLVSLRHQVADINLGRPGGCNSLGNSMYQQIRNQAGKQRAGTNGNQIGASNRIQRLGKRFYVRRHEKQFFDASLTGGDFGLAAHPGSVVHQGFQLDVRSRGRIDVPACD